MKKALSSVLAILLTLAMLGMFTACKETEAPVEPESEISEEVVDTPVDVIPDDDTDPVADDVDEPTEEIPEETEAPAEEAKTPDQMNKEELVQFYNDAINTVREQKPGFTRTGVKKMESIKTSVLGGMADSVVNNIVKKKMPGNPETHKTAKGKDNKGEFFAPTAKSVIKTGDVTSASAAKDGANWVVTLKLGKEVNPGKTGNSKYSRVFDIATRQDVLDELKDSGVEGDVNKATLTYHSGKAVITVNEKGQIVKAYGEFYVDADAKEVKVSIIKGDIIAYQSTTNTYTDFVY